MAWFPVRLAARINGAAAQMFAAGKKRFGLVGNISRAGRQCFAFYQ